MGRTAYFDAASGAAAAADASATLAPMASPDLDPQTARTGVRVEVAGEGRATISTGLTLLDHLLGLLVRRARFDVVLEVAPHSVEAELAAAGRALGEALELPLRADAASGSGHGIAVADEALAFVVVEATERAHLAWNVDLSRERVAGLAGDAISRFLHELAEAARLTIHVRLLEGQDRQHVLESIFKALGEALGRACREPI
jgi:imidazoleglycerol-phosphate dehydratase